MSNYQYKGKGFVQLTGNNKMATNALGGAQIGQGFIAQTVNQLNSAWNSNKYAKSPVFTFQEPEQNVSRYEIFESKKDILALSVCWARLRDKDSGNNLYRINSMVDDVLFNELTLDDIDYANKIRNYYVNKITVLTLKNIELTPFRKDLKELVNSDGRKFKESVIPLAYRLPEFYEYDLAFEELVYNYNRELKNFESTEPLTLTKDLSLVKTFNVNTRRQKRKEYWFKDIDNNLNSYYLDIDNPLMGLLDKFVEKDITITGTFERCDKDGNEFIKMSSLSFG